MFEKANPYMTEELSNAAAAHLCGCRCVSDSGTVGGIIQKGVDKNGCHSNCVGALSDNYNANYSAAYSDRKWS